MAAATGVSQKAVLRIWRAFGLQPHHTETFKPSSDPFFAEKVRDIVGLYLNPPDKAIVLCVDEKSQVQALDRTQLLFPMRPGLPARQTHDYTRHGTTSPFAALNAATGKIIGACHRRHRHSEFIKFLNLIDGNVPTNEELEIHLVMDNYQTHKTPQVKRWFLQHPRYHVHFTPTIASWLNLVERFFAEITQKRVRPGTFKSVAQLERAIRDYLDHHNDNPRPFVWTADADSKFSKIERYCEGISNTKHEIDCWKISNQTRRWLAAALLDIEPRLRKVKGYRHLPLLWRRHCHLSVMTLSEPSAPPHNLPVRLCQAFGQGGVLKLRKGRATGGDIERAIAVVRNRPLSR